MNNDLIRRGELNKAIETWDKFACLPDGKLYPTRELEHPEMFVHYMRVDDVTTAIDNMPTASLPDFKEGYKQAIIDGKTNFSRPEGEWYHSCDKGWECSQCHEVVKNMPTEMRKAKYNFCPHCGADMRGGSEDE